MPPLPKFFDASEPDLGFLEGFQINIEPVNDPLVSNILSGAGLIGGTAKIVAALPETYTYTVTKLVPVEVIKHSVTSSLGGTKVLGTKVIYKSVTETVTAKIAGSGKLIAGLTNPITAVIVLVIALGYIQKEIDEKRKQRDLARQRSEIDNLNRQIEQLNNQERELQRRLEKQIENSTKSLSNKVLEGKLNLNKITNSITHIVKQGDTLSQIAKKYGVPLQTIIQNNSFRSSNPDLIYPGEIVRISPSSAVSDNKLFSFDNKVLNTSKLTPNLKYQRSSQTDNNLPNEVKIPSLSNNLEEVEVLGFYELEDRIELIETKLNEIWVDGDTEMEIINLIDNTPVEDIQGLFSGLIDKKLIEPLEGHINGGNYLEYHRVLYKTWLRGQNPEVYQNEALKRLSQFDKKQDIGSFGKNKVLFYSNQGVVGRLKNKATTYIGNVSVQDGQISFDLSELGLYPFAPMEKYSFGEYPYPSYIPFEMVAINFITASETFNAKKGEIKLLPAISLFALEQEQFSDELDLATNVAFTFVPGFGQLTKFQKLEAIILSSIPAINIVIDELRDELSLSKEGQSFLRYWDVLYKVVQYYGVAQVSINLYKGFNSVYKKLKQNKILKYEKHLDELVETFDEIKLISRVGEVTKEYVKSKLPKGFVEALKKLGKSEEEIIEYFKNYHNNSTNKSFFNDFETYFNLGNNYGLTYDEAFVVWGYTTNLFYGELNQWLRTGKNIGQTQSMKRLLEKAINKLPEYKGREAFRALEIKDPSGLKLKEFLESHSEGKIVEYKDFVSSGSNTDAAFFNKANKNIRIKFENLKSARVISDFADGIKYRGYAPEELLIPPNKKFKILDVYKESFVTDFHKEEFIYFITVTEF